MPEQGPERLRCTNGCDHEWRTVDEIGDWTHDFAKPELTVRQWASTKDIWAAGNCELAHDELRRLIETAGGVLCAYALKAITLPGAVSHLSDGLHRWAIAAELGLATVPVQMAHQLAETPTWP